ncbi:MAG: trigger factor [bacterium]
MKSTLEKISSIRQALTIEAPAEMVDRAFDSAMEKVKKEAKVPGFRQGKVSEQVLTQKFGQDIEVEAVKELVRVSYPAATQEAQVNPLSDPEIEPKGRIVRGQPYTYKAIFEIYPEVAAAGYDNLKLECEGVEIKDSEVEAELNRLQRQMTQLEPAPEGELGPGMLGMIDFKGAAAGQSFEGSEAQDYVVDFGTGALLEQFEVEIKGMKEKEERDIAFHYPTDFFKREIAGKKGEFRVKLKELRRKVIPEINDDFAKSLGDFQDISAVRKDLKERIAAYKENLKRSTLREHAIRQIIANNQDLEVPTTLIDSELGNMLEQLRQRFEAQGRKLTDAKIDPKQFVHENIKEATDRARGFMLARAISIQEKIEVTDAEFDDRINHIAAEYRSAPAQIREHFEKNKMMDGLKAQMLFEKTLDFVVSKAKVAEVKPKKG